MKQISEILEKKGGTTWSVSPDQSVYDALQVMADKGIGAVLVMQDGKLCGILSERDYARKVSLEGLSARSCTVSDIMTSKVLHVSRTHSVDECLEMMTDKHLRHLPVLESDDVIGMVSIGDLVKAIIEEQQLLINQLQQYISG